MVPSGHSAPIGGAHSNSLLQPNSGMLTDHGSQMTSQSSFPLLVSPRTQYNNTTNLLGNGHNVSSLINQSFGSGGQNSNAKTELDPLSNVGNGLGFNLPSSLFGPSNQMHEQQFQNPMLPEQIEHGQQFSNPQVSQQQQIQYNQKIMGGLNSIGQVKLEPSNDQFQALRNHGSVKLEPQQLQNMRDLGPIKIEPQHSDPSLFMHQQQFLQMSRQSSQAAANMLHQQRLMQLQQQQLMKAIPQHRSHFQQTNMPLRSPPVKLGYEPGTCARRLTHYMCQQQRRPQDNNIDFWRKFVAEYFAPNAKKKWCVSMYGSGRQTTGVFPQDVWHCEICKRKPGRGFEATAEVLPRLFKIKYESGTLEELLYVDMPHEYHNSFGQIVLDYAKAIQESVFEQLRVVREGQLRIVFSPDLKIWSWEFCARSHEELIPRRLLMPQVSQLGVAAQKYQAATQNSSSIISAPELQNNCNMFVASARQLAKALEVPLVNDLGYTKRYVRCLQISEVVNSMKDLIDYSRDTVTGPMESLVKFPKRTAPSQSQQPSEHQQMSQNSNCDKFPGPNNNTTNPALASTSASTIAGLLHQNTMGSRQNTMNTPNGPYVCNPIQIQSPTLSSNTLQQAQPNHISPFQSPTPSSNNALTSHMSSANSPADMSGDVDPGNSQSSVQKIIHEIMMSNKIEANNVTGIMENRTGNPGSAGMNGIRVAMGNNGSINSSNNGNSNQVSMDGRVGRLLMGRDEGMNYQPPDLGNQLFGGFNNLQFDWKQ